MFDVPLSDELLINVGFKLEQVGEDTYLSKILEDGSTEKVMKLNVEANTEQAQDDVNSLTEGENTANSRCKRRYIYC